jgi:polyphosphate:AMP phosphotransferase
MFEAAKVGRSVPGRLFREELPALRTRLLEAQASLQAESVPLVVLLAGLEGAGKGEVVNRLREWLDARGVDVHAFWDLSDEERSRPRYWRFWRTLPPRGRIAVLFGGWYLAPIEARYAEDGDPLAHDRELERIREFERTLVEDGAVVVKLWYHFSEHDQRRRLARLARDDRSRWSHLPKQDRGLPRHYRRFEHVAEQVLRATDTGRAPWHVIEATDHHYRDLTTGKLLLAAMEDRLRSLGAQADAADATTPACANLPDDPHARVTVLDRLSVPSPMEKSDYKRKLHRLQAEAAELAWEGFHQRRSTIAVFEGVDAAGKGGAIHRIARAVDARLLQAVPIAAPTDEELARHHLWRFWRHVPRDGYMTLFDRSWYGRVLVERVEGLTPPARWKRAYQEINDFEAQLHEHGIVVVKLWLQISREEQAARFEARQQTPYKNHKITREDWRNRAHWDAYRMAVNEMVERTSTELVPWTLVCADDKRHARIEVLRTLTRAMRHAFGQ